MGKTTRRDLLKGGALAGLSGVTGRIPSLAAQQGENQRSTDLRWQAPPQQQGNNLNLIVLVSDTFRADNLAAYGSQWVETPYLNRFADESVLFENFYPEGMPTVVIRRQLYTGRRVLPTHLYFQQDAVRLPGWHQLFLEDVTLSETLLASGYTTALVADLYVIFEPDRNFHRGFHSFQWIRGKQLDFYGTARREQQDVSAFYPADYLARVDKTDQFMTRGPLSSFLAQYAANRKQWIKKGDSLVQQTAESAINWLEENHDQGPFYLHVETFDPHEPWDPPQHFLEKYLKEPTPHSWPEPPYDVRVKVPEEGVRRFRANYAGLASTVDYWYGQVLDKIRKLGLYDNSIIVFLSDHGAMLNEQDQWLKGPDRLRKQVTHVPLLIHLPHNQYAGKRVSGFVQTPDVVPTVLGRLNLKPSPRVTGEDLWPYVTGERTNKREYAVSGYGWVGSIRTPEWNYSAVWNKGIWEEEAYRRNYKPAQVDPQRDYKPQLYDLKNDPDELKTVADQHPEVLTELQAKMDEYIESGRGITNGTFSQEL